MLALHYPPDDTLTLTALVLRLEEVDGRAPLVALPFDRHVDISHLPTIAHAQRWEEGAGTHRDDARSATWFERTCREREMGGGGHVGGGGHGGVS
eukprot:5824066-Prymnesium_polylepis.1